MTAFDPLKALDWGVQAPGSWITYYFTPAGQPVSDSDNERSLGDSQPWDEQAKAEVRAAFSIFSEITNLRFGEVLESSGEPGQPSMDPMLTLQLFSDESDPSSLGFCLPMGVKEEARAAFNIASDGWKGGLQPGSVMFETLLHEFGHGLGLSHPHDAGLTNTSPVFPGVVDPFGDGGYGEYDLNQTVWTMMSYVEGWPTGPDGVTDALGYGHVMTPMAFDIAVLQAKYGANLATRTGDDVYDLADEDAAGTGYACIWDAGGTDTIRYTGARDAAIDLNAATLQWEVGGAGWVSYARGIHGGYTIANGVIIEDAVLGAGNDGVRGNDADNAITGGLGNDTLDGGDGCDTAVYHVSLAEQSQALEMERGAYVLSGAEGTDTLRNVEVFAFTDGTVRLGDDRLVDDLAYAIENPDVWAAGIDAEAHYDAHGWREGRDPNGVFSTRGYLAANPDVAKAGLNPLAHYMDHGWQEGRATSAAFDSRVYLERNEDVAAAGLDPLLHYLTHGMAEGREAYAAVGGTIAEGFDATFYLLANPDVAEAGADARTHWRTEGWQEGRDPNGWFDTDAYLTANPDVAAAGINPLAHYMGWGWHEGRDAGPRFDTEAYLAANPDVAAAGLNPLQHFLAYGIHEGRDAITVA
ncbi:M10 family metallopeptidase [Roseicella aquatilis]|uniref:Peptidase M10 serralysin C-terminal domain-containing protein n=1 Tax=Roseicella aquatilis TaxID=2527868 RepID=A0A4R4DUS1_9PROT|nr:M10 family metallopeptidase [Roseicella aquatilis]TCZ64030.1 hypothetical protein EXY23_08660 [Roseicella aquatilis]